MGINGGPNRLLLAEELLLLFLDDETGKFTVGPPRADYALAGALLIELAVDERLTVTHTTGLLLHRQWVTVVPGELLDDPVLVDALGTIDAKPRSAQSLVQTLSKGLRQRLLDRLCEREIVRHEEGRVLGVFPTHRWPGVDLSSEAVTRERLHAVLVNGLTPDVRTTALIAVLTAVDQAHVVLGDLDRDTAKRVKRRAKELSEGAWAAEAVRKAVEAVQAAVMASMTATIVATTTTT